MIVWSRALRAASATAACGFAAATVGAQTPAVGQPRLAVIEGVALDSLHNAYLRGALLLVEGADATTMTDSSGRFRFDSVLPGLRRIFVVHPILDTVGVALVTAPLQIAPGQHLGLVIGVPSAQTLLGLKCSAAERAAGPDALLGLVHFAGSDQAAAGAEVALEWTDYDVVDKRRLQTTSRRSVAKVSESGQFHLCGLPQDLSGLLTASIAGDTTSAVQVHLSALLGIAALELPKPATAGNAASSEPNVARNAAGPTPSERGTAVLTGRVLDPHGLPVSQAQVSIAADSLATVSGADGSFVMKNLRAGMRTVSVRRLGFEPIDVPVNLNGNSPNAITVRLATLVPVLDPVSVTAAYAQEALDRIGFTKRKKGAGGWYLTPEDIAARNATQLPDLLAHAPNLRIAYYGSHAAIIAHPRGPGHGCVNYFLDGSMWLAGRGIENSIWPSDVGAVEVYEAGFAPPEFTRPLQICETVVIWSKTKLGL